MQDQLRLLLLKLPLIIPPFILTLLFSFYKSLSFTLLDRYTIVSIVNINAWIPAINKLNVCHNNMGITEIISPVAPVAASPIIRLVKIPPANILPNKRKPSVDRKSVV